jgi:hypothetical protein
MQEISSVGCILPSVGRILPSIKPVGKAQTLDATRMEDVRNDMERLGKREIRAFCEERRGRKAQDRTPKAQGVMTARRGTRSTTMKHKNTWKESPLRRERILPPGKPVYRIQVVCAGLGLME